MGRGWGVGALGCGNESIKIFLFVSNVIFLLAGGGLLGVSIYLFTELQDVKGAFENDGFLVGVPITGCLVGTMVMISSVLGGLGAVLEMPKMIKGFIIFQFVGLLFQIGIFITVLVYDVDKGAQDQLQDAMKTPFNSCAVIKDGNRVACKWLAPLQKSLKCCGYNTASKPDKDAWKNACQMGDDTEFAAAATRATQFCNTAILDYVKQNLVYVYSVIGGLFFLNILVIIGAYRLIFGIQQDNKFK